MSPQYSMSELCQGQGGELCPPSAVPMSNRSQIHHRRNQEPDQIDSCHGQAAINEPRVHQRREWQEDEAKDEEQDAMKGPVQVMREQEQEHYRDAWKREDQDQE
jgi:hypothetical protein